MRNFKTGATRDGEVGKFDPEGFESPLVDHAYHKYMHKHRVQADGKLRTSDNWQKGIDRDTYLKCMNRHFNDLRALHRGLAVLKRKLDHGEETLVCVAGDISVDINDWRVVTLIEALCALLFNVKGYLFELLMGR